VKLWGSIRKVLLNVASDFVEVNEDLERVTVATAGGADLYPRGYSVPEAEVTIRARAAQKDGRIFLFGLGGAESEEESIEVTVKATVRTTPLNTEELTMIATTKEKEIEAKLAERNIKRASDGSWTLEETHG